MKKFLLSAVCAAVLVSGSMAVKAAEKEMLPPPPPGHEMDHPTAGHEFAPKHKAMRDHGPKFDKEKHKKMAHKFAKELNLTDEQKAKADKIREEGRKKVEPLMKEMDELRGKMDKMREENMKEFEAILTPEQKTKLQEMKAKHDEMREHRKMEKKMRKAEKKAEKKK